MASQARILPVALGSCLVLAGCFEDAPNPMGESDDSPATSAPGSSGEATPPGSTTEEPTSSTSAGADDTTSTTEASTSSDDETTAAPNVCGDGMVGGDEECDGDDWAGSTCESLGYVPGRLACSESCTFDASGCVPAGMVLIPGGPFEMGSNDDPEEQPIRQVELSPFYIDLHEVTVAEYTACVDSGMCLAPVAGPSCNYMVAGRESHPINCVDSSRAQAYCGWIDGGVKRLPTEAEWEKAARGDDARTFPWGDAPLPSCSHLIMNDGGVGCGVGSTWMVGSRPMGASAFGALDMAGNVWEWVSDWYGPSYDPAETVDPTGPGMGTLRVLRGGGWYHSMAADFTATHRHEVAPDLADAYIGFRCVQVPPGP